MWFRPGHHLVHGESESVARSRHQRHAELSCQTNRRDQRDDGGILFNASGTATFTVHPTATTAYTCIATGSGGQTAQQSLTVTVTGTSPGGGGGTTPPTIVIQGGTTINTIYRFLTINASSGTYSPGGQHPAATFQWTSVNDSAAITERQFADTEYSAR